MSRAHDEDNRSRSGSHLLDGRNLLLGGTAVAAASALLSATSIQTAKAQQAAVQNILFTMGDVSDGSTSVTSSKTPKLDRIASEGMRFTDYYAEASCTAGRASRKFSSSDGSRF